MNQVQLINKTNELVLEIQDSIEIILAEREMDKPSHDTIINPTKKVFRKAITILLQYANNILIISRICHEVITLHRGLDTQASSAKLERSAQYVGSHFSHRPGLRSLFPVH